MKKVKVREVKEVEVKEATIKEAKVKEVKVTLLLDSPLWMRRCSFRWCLYLKAFPHSPHLNFRFSAAASLLSGGGGGGGS